MPDPLSVENDFLTRITEVIEENLTNEQFGVSELAREIGMSRSNLLRKIKKLTNLSASQFIRQVRLKNAMEILRERSLTVSEVSYEVGFGSTSYFIKCFHDYYGYPPGETGKKAFNEIESKQFEPTSQPHHLAAIMFTDIQGYTALMQQDEEKALEFRNRHREVFNAVTKKHNGKIIQFYGDGTLSTFHSAIDAVMCGIDLQKAFRNEPRIPVRIGIHSGDIIIAEDEIIGDGVNVASRIESLAVAESVFISEKVYDEIKNQSGIQTTSMGNFELKNVGKPLEVYAIANPGLVVPKREEITGKVKSSTSIEKGEFIPKVKKTWIKSLFIILVVILLGYLIYTSGIFNLTNKLISSSGESTDKKSIAVLPFINDSNDSTNVYIINGLMEAILNNLQKIEDLRVISRTSVEKYRNNPKIISEIAKELDVNYFVEGSGQKIGDEILLNIQLIEASTDKHLWAEQYKREVKDIFNLQKEVAKNIAGKIEVIITPEEEERIDKIPTENLDAYDYFLKGLDLLYKGAQEDLKGAIPYFEKAIELDNQFAHAYADLAITYYFLDANQTEKKYADQINQNADNALLFDSQLPQSLIAKALFYMYHDEYELAIPYLEKALEYNPNSALVVNILSDFYTRYIPNTTKYLEYALKGIQLDIGAHDSTTASIIYLHLSNAFMQSGFTDEAELYINKSLDYHPSNLYSEYVKAYILYAKTGDIKKTKELLIEALNKDSTRLDIMQEVAKISYFMRDYESAYNYYNRFIDIKEALNLDIYRSEDAKIAVVFSKMGHTAESEKYLSNFKEYADYDKSIYKNLSLAAYYSFKGDTKKAIEHMKLFSQQDNYHYWIILFLEMDPLMDNIKDLREFKKIFSEIESKFWNSHKQIKDSLEQKGLL